MINSELPLSEEGFYHGTPHRRSSLLHRVGRHPYSHRDRSICRRLPGLCIPPLRSQIIAAQQVSLKLLRRAACSIELIPGIELPTEYELPTRAGGGKEVHIVGLYIDPEHPLLIEKTNEFRRCRDARNEKIVAALQREGFSITTEALLAANPDSVITRANIARFFSTTAIRLGASPRRLKNISATAAMIMLSAISKSLPDGGSRTDPRRRGHRCISPSAALPHEPDDLTASDRRVKRSPP